MSHSEPDNVPISSILLAGRSGGERPIHIDLSTLDTLDGGAGAISAHLSTQLARRRGEKYLRYTASEELHIETLEVLLDMAKGKPIFPVFSISSVAKDRESLDAVRRALVYMLNHALSEESLQDTLIRTSNELEAQLLGPINSVATADEVAASLTNVRRKLWDLDFGRFAEIFCMCKNIPAAAICSGLYHMYSSRALAVRSMALDHGLTSMARSMSELVSSHLNYGTLLYDILRCESRHPRCARFPDSFSVFGGFRAVPDVDFADMLRELGIEEPASTYVMPLTVGVPGSATFPTRAAGKAFDDLCLTGSSVPEDADDSRLREEWPLHMGPCVQGMVCATYRACRIIESGCVLPFSPRASTVTVYLPSATGICDRCASWHLKWMRRRADAAFSLMSVLDDVVPRRLDSVNQIIFLPALRAHVLEVGEKYYVSGVPHGRIDHLENVFRGSQRSPLGAGFGDAVYSYDL